jgi:hypothetical protein
MVSGHAMNTTDQMRSAADTLEFVARLYALSNEPESVALSAKWLRHEADVLDRPIPGAP